MELVRRSQGNRGQRAPLTQRSYHPRWCWSGSPVQYLVHLIQVLEVDQCLVWASLGVRLPVWVGFVVTAGVLFFFFFSFFFFFFFFQRERERLGVILDYLLMAISLSFWLFVMILDFFFCFWRVGNYHQLIVWNWLDQLGDRIFYVNLLWFFFRKF